MLKDEKSLRSVALVLLFAVAAAGLPGCTGPAPAAGPEDTHLRAVLIPVLDVIPFFIAQQNGYYQEQGIQVELVPAKSAQERDTLLQAGQSDLALTDLQGVGIFDKETAQLKAVWTARRAYPEAPIFRIIAAPNTIINSPADLKGKSIGISHNTTIEYLTDRLLQAEGIAPSDVKYQEIPAINVRFEQLMNGNLDAATMPDPLAQGALAAGAHLVVDDARHPEYTQSVLAFRVDTLKAKPNTVKKFLVAWEKAVQELNANPDKYQNLLIEQGRVPQSILGSYKMPPFPEKGVPSQAEIVDVVKWLRSKGIVARDIPYGDMVDASFLPK